MTNQSASINSHTLANAAAARWFPAATVMTGTISTTNTRVTGTGTLFRSEMNMGDYLVNSSNIARKVLNIISDTDMILSSAFPVDLSGATCTRARNQVLRRLEVEFITNAGTIRNADQDTAGDWPAGGDNYDTSETLDTYLVPIFVTPGAGGARVIEAI